MRAKREKRTGHITCRCDACNRLTTVNRLPRPHETVLCRGCIEEWNRHEAPIKQLEFMYGCNSLTVH